MWGRQGFELADEIDGGGMGRLSMAEEGEGGHKCTRGTRVRLGASTVGEGHLPLSTRIEIVCLQYTYISRSGLVLGLTYTYLEIFPVTVYLLWNGAAARTDRRVAWARGQRDNFCGAGRLASARGCCPAGSVAKVSVQTTSDSS